MSKMTHEPGVMLGTPWSRSIAEGSNRGDAGGAAAHYVEVEAIDEAARHVGFSELAADDCTGVANVRIDRRVYPNFRRYQRMIQEITPDPVVAVGQPLA